MYVSSYMNIHENSREPQDRKCMLTDDEGKIKPLINT